MFQLEGSLKFGSLVPDKLLWSEFVREVQGVEGTIRFRSGDYGHSRQMRV